jgi:cell division protein FtsA
MGTTDAAQAVFDCGVRMGLPNGVGGLADRAAGPSYATSVGLVRWGARLQPATNGKHHHQQAPLGSAYQKTVRWLRDFF